MFSIRIIFSCQRVGLIKLLKREVSVKEIIIRNLFIIPCIFLLQIASAQTLSDGTNSVKLTTIPQWVSFVELQQQNNTSAFKTRYHLVDRQLNQDHDGNLSVYNRIITQPLTPTGLDEESTIEIYFKSLYQELEIHHINIERNGLVIDKLGDLIVNFLQNESESESAVYTGGTELNLILSNTRVNDIIDIAYTIKGQNPVFGNYFFDTSAISWGVNVDNLHLRYNLDPDHSYLNKIYNSTEVFTFSETDNKKIIELSLTNVNAVELEQNTPPWQTINSFVSVSEFSSWADVSLWANDLFTVKEEQSTELRQLSTELISAYPDPEEYILAALDFVQTNIRYISLSIGKIHTCLTLQTKCYGKVLEIVKIKHYY